MGRLVALIGDEVSLRPGGFFIEAPVHERCAELATGGLCPYLSRQRVPRRVPEAGVTTVGGPPEDLPSVGRTVAKRPVAIGITTAYAPALAPGHDGSPVMVYVAAAPWVRVRRYAWAEDRLAEVTACPARATANRVQPRRASRAVRRGR
jgi:hypothetical protein